MVCTLKFGLKALLIMQVIQSKTFSSGFKVENMNCGLKAVLKSLTLRPRFMFSTLKSDLKVLL